MSSLRKILTAARCRSVIAAWQKSRHSSRHTRLLNKSTAKANNGEGLCFCRHKEHSSLNEQCLTSLVVYKATVTTTGSQKENVGLTESPFKLKNRFNNNFFEMLSDLNQAVPKHLADESQTR